MIINFQRKDFTITRYYDLPPEAVCQQTKDSASDVDALEEFKCELERAVRYRLRSDVVVGSCLSGGLDSSSVVALAAKQLAEETSVLEEGSKNEAASKSTQSKLTAITSVVTETELDESFFASEVARQSGANWVTVEPTSTDFSDMFEEVIRLQEEPFTSPSVYMQFFVFRKAKEIGCKVMLDGQGGDETLLGYPKYFPAAFYHHFYRNGFRYGFGEVLKALRNNKALSIRQLFLYIFGTFFSGLRKIYMMRSFSFLRKEWKEFVGLAFLDRISQSLSLIHI